LVGLLLRLLDARVPELVRGVRRQSVHPRYLFAHLSPVHSEWDH
jgi:hypothetical protein